MSLRTIVLLLVALFCAPLSCSAPISPTLNRVARAACDVLSELSDETDSPYVEMAERFLRSGDLHSARDQLLRYLTMVKYDEDVLALIQLIESQIPPEMPKMLDPPTTAETPEPPADFGIEDDVNKVYPPAPILD